MQFSFQIRTGAIGELSRYVETRLSCSCCMTWRMLRKCLNRCVRYRIPDDCVRYEIRYNCGDGDNTRYMTITWDNGNEITVKWLTAFFEYYFHGICQGKTTRHLEQARRNAFRERCPKKFKAAFRERCPKTCCKRVSATSVLP